MGVSGEIRRTCPAAAIAGNARTRACSCLRCVTSVSDIKNAVTNKVEKQSDRTITILLSVFGIVLTALIGIFASNLLN